MADKTIRIGLPYLIQNQAEKEVTVNEALDMIDFYSGPSVISFITSLPDSPTNGDAYVLNSDNTVYPNFIAHRVNGSWEYYKPFDGLRVLNKADAIEYLYHNSAWSVYANSYKPVAGGSNITVKSITLTAATWANGTYTITDAAIGANDVITLTMPQSTTVTNYDTIAAAKIACQSQSSGSLILVALGTVPTIDVPVQLIIQGVTA